MNAWYCIETYASLRETRGSAPAISYVGISGERCAICHLGREVQVETAKGFRRRVCGTCFAIAERVHGSHLAPSLVGDWEAAEDNESRGSVTVYPRRGAAEEIIADRADRWRAVQPIVETTPPFVSPIAWLQCVESAILLATSPQGGLLFVCEKGRRVMPSLSWDPRRVQEMVDRAVSVVARRLESKDWREREVEMGGVDDWCTVSEAARRLGKSPSWVRRNMKVRDARPAGSKRPEYLVRKADVEKMERDRFGDD